MFKSYLFKGNTFIDFIKRLLFLFVFFISSTIHAQDDNKLQQLLAPFSETKHLKIAYEEKRFSLFFKHPRLYQGYIEYISPDTFIKYVKTPNQKKIMIQKDQLSLYQYNSDSPSKAPVKKEVSLDNYPQFKQLKALFSGLFKGQASELTQYYRYNIQPSSNDQTRLTLTSRISDPFTQSEQEKSNQKQKIEIIFQNEHITQIIMTGSGGERSELSFGDNLLHEQPGENNK